MSIVAAAAPAGELTGLAGFAADVIDALGAVGVGLLVALENLFPPIPSEIILGLGGFLAGQGQLSLPAVIVGSTAGSLAGALILYGLGATIGQRRLAAVIDRVPFVSRDDLARANSWFDRHGDLAVLLGRFIPVVRSLISIPAGIRRMPLGRFCLYTTLGSAIWNTAFALLGYLLGDRWQNIGGYSNWINLAILIILALIILIPAAQRLRHRRR